MKKEIQNCLTWYANMVGQTVQYDWGDRFCRKEIKKYTNMLMEELKKHIDWNNITEEEALELGFRRWSDDEPDLYLIPLYLSPILPIGTELTCINGETVIYNGTNIDNDIRFGCIAHGIRIRKE